jgi:hypothetical protein
VVTINKKGGNNRIDMAVKFWKHKSDELVVIDLIDLRKQKYKRAERKQQYVTQRNEPLQSQN